MRLPSLSARRLGWLAVGTGVKSLRTSFSAWSARLCNLLAHLKHVADHHDLIDLLVVKCLQSRSEVLDVLMDVSNEAESHYSARFMISLFCQPVFVEVGVLSGIVTGDIVGIVDGAVDHLSW
jgi:hypothetical protein